MKKYFKLIISASLLLCGVIAQENQSAKDLANSEAMKEVQNAAADIEKFPSSVLYDYASKKLGKKGKIIGEVNADNSIYQIGSATTVISSGSRGFITSRNVAFRKAVLQAKAEFVRLQGMRIASEESAKYFEDFGQGTDPDTQKKASMLSKLKRLANEKVDNALIEMGVSRTEVSSMNQEQKEKMVEEEYSARGLQLAAGMLKGLSICKIVEGQIKGGDYEVAVLMKYSPENQKLAAMIGQDNNAYIDPAKPSKTLDKIKKQEAKDLIPRLGVITTVDSNGQYVVIAFGQAEVRKVSRRQSAEVNRAYAKAANQARDNLKNFVAQDISVEEITENAEKLTEYADGSQNLFTEDRFEQVVAAKMSVVDNLRSYPMKRWTGTHPISGDTIAGVVVAWSKDLADKSRAVEETLNTSDADLLRDQNSNDSSDSESISNETGIMMGGDDEDF